MKQFRDTQGQLHDLLAGGQRHPRPVARPPGWRLLTDCWISGVPGPRENLQAFLLQFSSLASACVLNSDTRLRSLQVPADDGCAVLLWSWFLHSPAHVSATTH